MKFYLIGIGGTGMSAIAELLHEEGHEVLGSDARNSDVMQRMNARGIDALVGNDPARLGPGMTVVLSSAIRESNPELVRARELGLEVIHRSAALQLASQRKDFVAVAGTHGKTTTSAMLAVALTQNGLDPSMAVGSTVVGFGSGARLGGGNIMVAEADESDRSFLNYSPRIAIVTNVEPDHLDHFHTEEAYREVFEEFLGRIVPGGLLVACNDDPGSKALARVARNRGIRTMGYGETGPDVVIVGQAFQYGGQRYPIRLRVRGEHNLLNAAGAFAAGIELGVAPEAMVAGLEMFSGTVRRFEARGTRHGVSVVDDYAHHPSEVVATLRTARQVTDGRVLVLYQPLLFSRTRDFADRFAQALDAADFVVVTDIYGSREDPIPGVTSELISNLMTRGIYVGDGERAAARIAREARSGDLLLTMGAEGVAELADVVLEHL